MSQQQTETPTGAATTPIAPSLAAADAGPSAGWLNVALVLLVVVVFGRLLNYSYIEWDDQETIFQVARLNPPTAQAFVDAWTKPFLSIWVPVTHTLWAVMAWVFGSQTAEGHQIAVVPFRVLSLALHAGSVLLVHSILRRIRIGGWLGALAAAMFAVHPVQVESVAWISGQKDLLATLFVLAAVRTALEAAVRDGVGWLIASWSLGVLAMLSKPQAVTAPLIIAAVLFGTGVPWRRIGIIAAPLLVPALAVAIVGKLVQPALRTEDVALWFRPIVALDAIGFYGYKLLLPANLVLDYARRPSTVLTARTLPSAIGGLVVVAVFVGIAIRRRDRLMAAGLLAALAGVLPVLGFLPFDFQYLSTVTDHYLYAGMLGVVIVVACALRPIPPTLLKALLLPLIGVWCVLSFVQAATWRDTVDLFERNLVLVPDSMASQRVLSYQSFRAGQRGDEARALKLMQQALETHPDDPLVLYNLGNARFQRNEFDLAHAAYARAIEVAPDRVEFRFNFAMLLIREQRLAEAEQQLSAALALEPASERVQAALTKLRMLRQATPATGPTSGPVRR